MKSGSWAANEEMNCIAFDWRIADDRPSQGLMEVDLLGRLAIPTTAPLVSRIDSLVAEYCPKVVVVYTIGADLPCSGELAVISGLLGRVASTLPVVVQIAGEQRADVLRNRWFRQAPWEVFEDDETVQMLAIHWLTYCQGA